jgi:beta-glucosidase
MQRAFPPGFRWGTATSSHQVEGNNTCNDWWLFEQQPGRIRNGDRSGLACDWWRNGEADFDRMARLYQNAHRLSVEWSRLQPEEARWDDAAVARYRQMLLGLRSRGIEPMVTLHHFTLPWWVARAGGWENARIVGWFARYARHCTEWFGEFCGQWVPINEPNVIVILGYLLARHPPGLRNPLRARRAIPHLLRAHAAAYQEIHKIQPQAAVGSAHNIRLFDPARPSSRPDRWVAQAGSQFCNWVWLDVLARGAGRSVLWSGRLEECAGTLDFIGINYYTRDCLRVAPSRPKEGFWRVVHAQGAVMSDFGYGEIYPDGLRRALVETWHRYGVPLYVTENGLPDRDDHLRPRFLYDHLSTLCDAVNAGVPVRGYYHWSLVDNFEWAEGWAMKFGLIAVDPFTQRRVERRSARLYATICRSGTLPNRESLDELIGSVPSP